MSMKVTCRFAANDELRSVGFEKQFEDPHVSVIDKAVLMQQCKAVDHGRILAMIVGESRHMDHHLW